MAKKISFMAALAGSLLLHIVLAGLLFINAQFNKPTIKKPVQSTKPVVQAAIVNQGDVNKQVDKLKKAKLKQQADEKARARKLKKERARIKELERQRKKREAEKTASDKLAKAAKKKQKDADAKAKKAIANRKKQEKAAAEAKKKRLAEDKAAAKAKAKRIADAKAAKAKKLAAQKAAKAKAEKKRLEKLRLEKEARERAERERILAEEMASEQAELTKARQRAVLSEVDKYTALISGAIQRQWNVDESMKGKQCVLNIKLSSSGLVYDVKPISGDKFVCKSAQDAVYKAHTLPVSKDPEVFAKLKEINLTVQPEFE